MLTRRNIIVVAVLAAAVAGGLAALGLGAMKVAQADQWPSRPITMVVPFAAGGPTDVVGRLLADRLGDVLGQQVVSKILAGRAG
jgi:tripartite-type tricarboxylate transporter receptor subunit TctC